MFAAAILALTIPFPAAGQRLPYVEKCYMIGAVAPGPTNLVIQGRDVAVYRTGAWATLLDVVEGTNTVEVAGSNHWFVVAAKSDADEAPSRTYEKLPYAGDVAKPHPAGKAPAEITVILDAGHGGSDTGAVSPHGIPEKDANLRLAKAVKRELVARGYQVMMTREDDSFPELYDRPKVAHAAHADAFVSIHHNAPGYAKDPREVRYGCVYAWNGIGERLASAINARIVAALAGRLENRGVLHANYAVTRNPEIPSCLIEVDFITTPEGEESSWDPVRRKTVARAIADGIADWTELRP